MSLILEALRKSEAERRRGQAPDLFAELPPAPRPRGARLPAWSWVAAAAALGLGIAWWLRDDPVPTPTSTDSAGVDAIAVPGPRRVVERAPVAAAPQVPIGTPAPAPVLAAPPVPTAVEPAMDAVATPATGIAAAPVPARTRSAPAAAPAESAPLPAQPPASAAPRALPADAGVAMIHSLPADQRTALPPLKLTMHLWDERPAQRFVILDGQRLGEGGRLGELVVDTIEPDAVLLDWNGRKLRLPLR